MRGRKKRMGNVHIYQTYLIACYSFRMRGDLYPINQEDGLKKYVGIFFAFTGGVGEEG